MSKTIVKLKNDNYDDVRIDNRSIQRDMITASLTDNYVITATSTYENLPLEKWTLAGDKLSVNADGSIAISDDVKKIKLSGQVCFNAIVSSGNKYLTIKNGDGTKTYSMTRGYGSTGVFNIPIPEQLLDVKNDDTIYFRVYSTSLDTLAGSSEHLRTYFSIEVIE